MSCDSNHEHPVELQLIAVEYEMDQLYEMEITITKPVLDVPDSAF
jgi:hypothetical protein